MALVGLEALWADQASTLRLARAVSELGPLSGWRCVQSATYNYDPRRERADSTLLADAPEAILSGVEVERVEASLRGGDTVIWTRVPSAKPSSSQIASGLDGASGEQRVYVLSPGKLQVISMDSSDHSQTTICNSHLGNWQIVGEHGLGGG
jgi:hypothetical protein